MMLLNVFGFLRGEELTCLAIEDVTLSEDHQWLTLLLCWSKTDQTGDGVIVDVPRAFETWLDPVRATLDWIAWLDQQGVQEGPLFRQMNKNGRALYVHPRAKAPWPRQGGMSREAYTSVLQRWTDRAGVPGDFASRSDRRGAATEASRRGATPSEIADTGRWKPGSTVLWRYIEGLNRNDRRRNHPMARVLRSSSAAELAADGAAAPGRRRRRTGRETGTLRSMATEKVTIRIPRDRVLAAARGIAGRTGVPFSTWVYRAIRSAVLEDELHRLAEEAPPPWSPREQAEHEAFINACLDET